VRDADGAPLMRAVDVAHGQALRIEFTDSEISATADGHPHEPHARRARPKAAKDDQGSLF